MIREREYAAMSGWTALVVLLAAAALSLWQMVANIKVGQRRAHRGVGHRRGVFVASADWPVHGQPERRQGAAVVWPLHRHGQDAGPALRQPALRQEAHLDARAQLRKRPPEGERPRRQPDRDRRGGGVEGRRHGRGALRGGQLRELRPRADRIRPAQHGDQLSLRRARRREALAARSHGQHCRPPPQGDPGSPVTRRRGCDRGAHHAPGLRAGNRRRDAAAPAGRRHHRRAVSGSSKARSAWWRWRSRCSRPRRSSTSTKSARRRWSATCSSCCAASAEPNRC